MNFPVLAEGVAPTLNLPLGCAHNILFGANTLVFNLLAKF